jgi:hypothetical protein
LIGFYNSGLNQAVNNNWLLYDTISDLLGVEFVIDSSKSPCRLALLYNTRPSDVYAIVLLRDIRGVAHSAKKLGNDPISAAQGWVRQYNRIYSIIQRLPGLKHMCVTYENLANDPLNERRRIADFIGSSPHDRKLLINTGHYHMVAGNALRHRGRINITPDSGWNQGLSSDMLEHIIRIRRGLNPGWDRLLARECLGPQDVR